MKNPFVSSTATFAAVSWYILLAGVHAVPPGFRDQGVATVPRATSFNFAPKQGGGHMMLVGSKWGKLYVVPDPYHSKHDVNEILDISDRVCHNGERGLQSVLAHPKFIENRWIYTYYAWDKFGNCTESAVDGPVNRLSRFTMKPNNQVDIDSEVVLFETSSLYDDIHNGGDMAFGKDGYLYVSVGDAGNRVDKVSQKLNMLLGSMIRITDTGGIPPGNPFTSEFGFKSARCNKNGLAPEGTVCEEIYAYGLRNPFRFAMDPNTPGDQVRLFFNDVGGSKWEETNELKAGKNYGWPTMEGPCTRGTNNKVCSKKDEFEDPIYWYAHTSEGGAAVGITFIPKGVWPDEYDGKVLFADFVFEQIYLLEEDSSKLCRSCNLPVPGWTNTTFHSTGGPVQLTFGPYKNTQALYYTTWGAGTPNVRRIRFVGGDNQAPVASLSVDTQSVAEGVMVNFDGSGSTDPDGDPLDYIWNFGDGSEEVRGPEKAKVSHQYMSAGEYRASLKVKDPLGYEDVAHLQITVGSKPVVTMHSPFEGESFSVGDIITLIGSAIDGRGNPMQDEALTWEVRRHHNTHYHPFLDPTNGNLITLHEAPGPEDFEAATNSYLEVILTATDDSGVQGTLSRIVLPKLVAINFDSLPQGLALILDDFSLTTPVEVVSWENHKLRVEAPDQGPWIWSHWSHGADQNHTIVVKTKDERPLYTAKFEPSPVTPLLNFSGNDLSPDEPRFSLCEGDCDGDDECGPGLVCFFRGADSSEGIPANAPVPGCQGEAYDEIDFCILEQGEGETRTEGATLIPTLEPSSVTPFLQEIGNNLNPNEPRFSLCQGDCDGDDECGPGLVCFFRGADSSEGIPANASVPGCQGEARDEIDFCILSHHPTILPTHSPAVTFAPSRAPIDTPTDRPSSAPSVQISNKLKLTATAFRVSLVIPISGGGDQQLRRRQMQEEVNLNEWHKVTHKHLVNQISTTYPALAQLDLEFKQDFVTKSLSPSIVEVTQAMMATGYFRISKDEPTLQQLDQVILQSFQGTPKFAYLLLLEQSEDAILQQTHNVSAAAAPDVSRAQTGSNDEPTKSEGSNYSLFIYIGAGVGALVLALLGGLWVNKRRQKRLRQLDDNKAMAIKHNDTGSTSKSSDLSPDLLPDDPERPPPESQRSTSEEEEDDDDGMSAASSMHSYIDNSSLAPQKELYHIRERSEKDDASSGIASVSMVSTSSDSSAYSEDDKADDWEADSKETGMEKKKKKRLPDEESGLYPDDDSILPLERPGSVLLGNPEVTSSQQAQDFSSVWENSEGSPEKTAPATTKRRNGASVRVAEDTRPWETKYGIPVEEASEKESGVAPGQT